MDLEPQPALIHELVWRRADVAKMWPVPDQQDDKYSRGVVGIDTGSARYPGAAVLSVLGALRSGAGFIRFNGEPAAQAAIVARAPSVTHGDGRVNAWVLGCGWDDQTNNLDRLRHRLADGVPCVIDATALGLLPGETRTLPPGCLLTPHAGELALLLSTTRAEIEAAPVASAQAVADRFDAAVLLKGSRQIVATPGSSLVEVALPGPAWAAQAGSGDVLAGVCGMLLAAGVTPAAAGVAAASLQALTGRRHPGPYSPDGLADFFPATIAALLGGPDTPAQS